MNVIKILTSIKEKLESKRSNAFSFPGRLSGEKIGLTFALKIVNEELMKAKSHSFTPKPGDTKRYKNRKITLVTPNGKIHTNILKKNL